MPCAVCNERVHGPGAMRYSFLEKKQATGVNCLGQMLVVLLLMYVYLAQNGGLTSNSGSLERGQVWDALSFKLMPYFSLKKKCRLWLQFTWVQL